MRDGEIPVRFRTAVGEWGAGDEVMLPATELPWLLALDAVEVLEEDQPLPQRVPPWRKRELLVAAGWRQEGDASEDRWAPPERLSPAVSLEAAWCSYLAEHSASA